MKPTTENNSFLGLKWILSHLIVISYNLYPSYVTFLILKLFMSLFYGHLLQPKPGKLIFIGEE